MLNKSYNILVTGCGGDIGQSIGKILVESPQFHKIVGSDLTEDHAGKFIFDHVIILPRCDDPSYMEKLEAALDQFNIDLILPVSEAELRYFNSLNINDNLFGRIIIMPNNKSMEIGFDKLATANFLKNNGLPYPKTTLVKDIKLPVDLPLILKSRSGSGSKNLFVLSEQKELKFYSEMFPEFVAQEFVGNSDVEYTCGLFASSNEEIRHISFKRKLIGGFSGFGVFEENEEIEQLLLKIAKALKLRGSINVQLRLTGRGPVVFEINPRFSSTVLFRHLMGFKDVLWSIEDRVNQSVSPYLRNKSILKFYKGFNEYVD
jgi:carbamoyl-phosphate synthase large subunit